MKHICNKRCSVRLKPNAPILAKIESEFRHLADYKRSRSLMKKYLVPDLFDSLKNRVTCFGSTLLDVIISGVENTASKIGVYAPDGEAYKVFHELFDQIIEEYHGCKQHCVVEYGLVHKITNLDYEKKYLVAIKISGNRSLHGYPFNRRLNEPDFLQIETRVVRYLLRFEGEFKGTYHSLINMAKKDIENLFSENYLIRHRYDKFAEEAFGSRFWPTGRGIFWNKDESFYVWINVEDHLSIVSTEKSGDLGACYRRYVRGLQKVGKIVAFLHDKQLGYLNLCPSYLGTGMEIAVELKLYNVPNYKNIINDIALRYNLHIDLTCKDKCRYFDCIVVYKPRLGMNEFETIKWIEQAILAIIRADMHINLK